MYDILVVEDEREIQEILSKYLEREGHRVFTADDGVRALAFLDEQPVHLVILDIMMPGIDGLEVLRELRKVSRMPVILLTARGEEDDRLTGFDSGADDYVVKPYSPREVVRRVEALLRRVYERDGEEPEVLAEGDLRLFPGSRRFFRGDREIGLTGTEFDLMHYLFQNRGQVLTRQQIIDGAFGMDYEGFDRSIDTYVRRLRKKIGDDPRCPEYLHTRYGAGYQFGRNDR